MTLTKALTGREEAAKVTQATILGDEGKKKTGKKKKKTCALIYYSCFGILFSSGARTSEHNKRCTRLHSIVNKKGEIH